MVKSPVCIRTADQERTLCGGFSHNRSTVSYAHAVEQPEHLESLVTCEKCWAVYEDWRELKRVLKIDEL